ncbi:MAG: hypothetical protein WCH44_08260 [Betaproteobacteria bacterium]
MVTYISPVAASWPGSSSALPSGRKVGAVATAIQMGFEAIQISHDDTLRLAPAEHGRGFHSHATFGVQADDFGQSGGLDAGNDGEGERQLGWLFAVARVVWSCEIFGKVVHTHPFNTTPKRMATA